MPPSLILLVALLMSLSYCHSLMSAPQPTASRPCRLGGDPALGIETCPGPCDLRALQNRFSNKTGPHNPAAIYSRGQEVTIKYQRNNHGPGGFIRISLVPIDQMMNKSVHENNAFHYGCWGANPIAATTSEMQRNKRGFSVSGADGKLHNLPVSYYTVNVTIPAVVPDGVYALGWVWYGGMGGSIYNNVPEKPYPRGLFADYWSCAFVGVRGGSEMTENFQPAFRSDMERWWGDACMSANDAPGGCTYEPCIVRGKMQKPRPFQAGRRPGSITPADFEDTRTRGSGRRVPPVVSERIILRDALTALYEWKARAMRTSDERQLEG